MGTLNGKVAIVTGAGQGIGRAIALGLAAEGATVVVNSATQANADATAEAICAAGGTAHSKPGDVGDAGFANSLVDFAAKDCGGLHILVNNAGITRDTLIMRMKDEDWDAVLATNLKSAFLLSRAATRPMMKQRDGRIINITSIVGITGNAGQTNYAASKAGMIGFTKSLAKELGSRNITVNAIAPGFIQTRMTDAIPEDFKKKMFEQIPLGRFGNPEDIARAVVFLSGADSAYITGAVLEVTGGMGM